MLEPLEIREAETHELIDLYDEVEGELQFRLREGQKLASNSQFDTLVDKLHSSPSERAAFKAAVAADSYAELELSTGDVLITDHESTGGYHPYVEPCGDHGDAHPRDILGEIASAVIDATDTIVTRVEWDGRNEVYHVSQPKDKLLSG